MEERLEHLERAISLAADQNHDWQMWLTVLRRASSNIARASGEPYLYLSDPPMVRRCVKPSTWQPYPVIDADVDSDSWMSLMRKVENGP